MEFAAMNAKSGELGRGQVERSIYKAIDFLHQSQLSHGEFKTYASPDQEMRDQCILDSSPFATALVLYSIRPVSSPKVQEMTANGLRFLQEEMEGPGLWRYWSSRNQRHRLLPPDLDDTCCISFILKKNHRSLPPNRDIILANRNHEGVFYTWLTPRSSSPSLPVPEVADVLNREALLMLALSGQMDDVDCVVNANVLLYLGDNEDTKGAVGYLVDIVLNEKEDGCSHFYPGRLFLYYMLSRAYHEGVHSLKSVRVPVKDRVIRRQGKDGSFGNELLTALAVCTLLNFDSLTPEVPKAIAYLLKAQRKGGSWPMIPMYLGPAPYYGSEDLTTALCVEALARSHQLH
jgi:hypothetical protein